MSQFSKVVLGGVRDIRFGCALDEAFQTKSCSVRFHKRLVRVTFVAAQCVVEMRNYKPFRIGLYLKEGFEQGGAICASADGDYNR